MIKALLVAVLIFILWQFIASAMEYFFKEIMVSGSAFSLRSGFFMREETNSPYRFITNVSERQGIIDRILGVSTFVVELISDETANPQSDRITLTEMDKEFGDVLQGILLDHANMQKMKVTS